MKLGLQAATAFALTFAALSAPAADGGFVDVLASPAQPSALAAKTLLQSVVKAGRQLVAVGQRGHVLRSSDGGLTWAAAEVPVTSDLTAVYFVDERNGWAVGHDGVILASVDGGATWRLQMDGLRASAAIVASMERAAAADPRSERIRKLLEEARRYVSQGPDKPFLDVWFADARNGFAVGAYNLLFRTQDGGRTWEPWFDRADNPKLLNLYAIRPAAGAVFIAGEGGLVLKLDEKAQQFRSVATPYTGSYFGVAGTADTAVVFGLRGNVFTSANAGRNWTRVDAGLAAAVVASARTDHGALLLADITGRVVMSDDGARTFKPLALKPAVPVTGLASLDDGTLALVGPRGATLARILPH